MDVIIHSLAELTALADQVAAKVRPGEVIALEGPLAAGKTTFTQLLLTAMNYPGSVNSPTFVIEHRYPVTWRDIQTVIHLDLYRLSPEEVKSLDWDDYLGSAHQLVIIEWPDNAKDYLPKMLKTITLEIIDAKTRRFTLPPAFC